MRISPLTMGSIALNFMLVGAFIVTSPWDPQSSRASSVASTVTENSAQSYANACNQGVSKETAYRMALAEARAKTVGVVPDDYWKPAPVRAQQRHEAESRSAAATRALLLKNFGPQAQEQPEFAEVFKPLRHRFGFLSADKQLQLQQILSETGEGGLSFSGKNSRSRDDRVTRVRALLNDSEFKEYQLRESPLAMRLANSGMDFTEAEFRAVYDAAAPFAAQDDRSDPLRAAMPAIKRVLTAERFAELERVQDPMYSWLRSGAARFGTNHDATLKAYHLIRDTDQRVLESNAAPMTAAARADLLATRDRQLEALLGKQMFNFIAPRLRAGTPGSSLLPGDPAAAFIPAR